ncbi:hypothetical protein Vafri_13583 [Volvox africanus]|nr:hypothetical protein Vafri_13583 [Volvox africanus]
MKSWCSAVLCQPKHARSMHDSGECLTRRNRSHLCGARHVAVKGSGEKGLKNTRPASVQKDMTADLLERAFALALSARLKQHAGIQVDVRSTAWGLMEGKFGGMTVRGYNWRTPLELTAEQLMVDVGEFILDYQKLVWQQTVALKNVPQGSVAFTLTSLDLANFMVHPIMVAAAARAVKGKAFIFDCRTASVRIDTKTGRGVITYEGTWAGDGQRYAVTMSTPPVKTAAQLRGSSAPAGPAAATASVVASSNTLEQLTVNARRVTPAATALISTTGSYASIGSVDEPLGVTAVAPVAAAAAAVAAASTMGSTRPGSPGRRVQTLTVAPQAYGASTVSADAGAGVLSAASIGSVDNEDAEVDAGTQVVAEGLRNFFRNLVINLQGIELRKPVLLVQLPGPGVGAAGGAARPLPGLSSSASSGPVAGAADSQAEAGLLPALLTITMKVAILQLPPLNMKF